MAKYKKAIKYCLFIFMSFAFFARPLEFVQAVGDCPYEQIKNAEGKCVCPKEKPFESPYDKGYCSDTRYDDYSVESKNTLDPNGAGVVSGGKGSQFEKDGQNGSIYGDKGVIGEMISKLLEYIFIVVGWLMGIAATIFDWVVQPANITDILNMDVVYEIWTMVRDLLNMAFIMMLLFSAFATIFQVDKYHIKKI